MTRRAPLVLFLVLATMVSTAAAEEDRAATLFDKGAEAYRAKKYDEAERLFEQAFALRQAADIAANLGAAELKQNKYTEAAEHLDYALKLMPATVAARERELTQKKRAEAFAKIGRLIVTVNVPATASCGTESKSTTAAKPVTLYLPPGKCTLVVQAEQYAEHRAELSLAAGSEQTRKVLLESTGGQVAGLPRWPAYLLLGLGGAGIIAGGALVGVAQTERSDAQSLADEIRGAGGRCDPTTAGFATRCDELGDTTGSAGTMERAAIGGFAAGGALAAAGLIYLLVAPAQTTPTKDDTAKDNTAAKNGIAASLRLLPTTNGFLFQGSF